LIRFSFQNTASVLINNKPVEKFASKEDFEKATWPGFYFDENEKNGMVHVKTNYLLTSELQRVSIKYK